MSLNIHHKINLFFLLFLHVSLMLNAANSQERKPGLGLEFLVDSEFNSIPEASAPLMGILPNKIDLISKMPTPGDQGAQGSCVGWAVGYALKSYQEYNRFSSGEQRPYSPSYIYNQIKIGDCNSGSYIVDALNILQRQGNTLLEEFPYDQNSCTTIPSENLKRAAAAGKISKWRRLNPENIDEIKAQLSSHQPIIIGMKVYNNFYSYMGGVYRSVSGNVLGGHAMIVIGYDDEKNSFLIQNSWGTDWGESGRIWMTYDLFSSIVREAYVTEDIQNDYPAVIVNRGQLLTTTDEPMKNGHYLLSSNGLYAAILQSDNNFVLYKNFGGANPRPLWNSKTDSSNPQSLFMQMQYDGNLVIYKGNSPLDNTGPLWNSRSYYKISAVHTLVMQDDGNLVVYRGEPNNLQVPAVWSTKTAQN